MNGCAAEVAVPAGMPVPGLCSPLWLGVDVLADMGAPEDVVARAGAIKAPGICRRGEMVTGPRITSWSSSSLMVADSSFSEV